MKKFEQPSYTIKELNVENTYGQFVIEPLERGFGTTLGNALRRVLLSSLPGASVYSFEISGVSHEFSPLEGVEEDVTAFMLNLKDLVLKIDDAENVTKDLKIDVLGPCEITGADIECPLGVEVVNKDVHIANVAKGGRFNAVLHAKNSRGYVTAENNVLAHGSNVIGRIYTDSKYSPVEKVSYEIENTRVGQDASYDRLIIDITTNGGLKPQEAIALASHILIAHLEPLVELETATKAVEVMTVTEVVSVNEWLDKPIDDLGLPPRCLNGLRRANIALVSELCALTEDEASKIRSLGKKSVKEIKDKIGS